MLGFVLTLSQCSGSSQTQDDDDDSAGEAGVAASGGSVAGKGGASGRGGSAGNAGSVSAGKGGAAGVGGTTVVRGGNGGTGGTAPGKTGGSAGIPQAGEAGGAGAPSVAGAGGDDGTGGEVSAGGAGAGGAEPGSGGAGDSLGGAGAGGSPELGLEGDSCSSAPPLGAATSGVTLEYTNDHGRASCFSWPLVGPDRSYAVTIAPQTRLEVNADPNDTFDLALYLVPAPAVNCTEIPTCAAGADVGNAGANELLAYDNVSSVYQSFYLIVDGYGAASGSGSYDLVAATMPVTPGEVCESAIPLATGVVVEGTLDGFLDDYTGSPTCISASARGTDAVYSITVPAGNTLTVVGTPTAAMDIALYAFDTTTAAGCRTATGCLGEADLYLGGVAETFTYTNAGASRTVFLHVDRFDLGAQEGGYSLSATLTAP